MHGFKRGAGCGPLRLTLAWAEAMKNWSWDRIRYVISPSHHVFGELQINAIRAEVPLMPDTYWAYGRQPLPNRVTSELPVSRPRIGHGAEKRRRIESTAAW